MTNLLILGGGSCQLNAFVRARKRGVRTVLFDYLPNPLAASLADEHRQVSTFDTRACLAEARRLDLDGVMTVGTDQPVYACARIAAALGLPALLAPQTALAVTNKAVMKKILSKNGIPTAEWFLADKQTLPRLPLEGPVVIKPLDNQGQRGVIRAESVEAAAPFFDTSLSFSRCGKLLCERYYPSDEITVNAWAHKGEARMLAVTDRMRFPHERHIGVCSAHRFPSVAGAGREDAVQALTQRVAESFGIAEGPLYIQLLVGAEGILVNELSSRIGGAFEDVFIPWLTGYDILDAVMDAALGLPFSPPPERFAVGGREVRVLMPFTGPGKIGRMPSEEELLAWDCVLDARFNFAAGDTVPAFTNAGGRLGVIVLKGENAADMQANLDRFYSAFTVEDETGKDMLLDAWRVR